MLIVEDDELRCEWFRGRLSACDLDITCDAGEAVRWLAEKQFDLILLDHDLREEHYWSDERDDERTGYGVAAWLAAHRDAQPRGAVVIHSLNYAGAERMLAALLAAGFDAECIPFHHLQSGLKF